MVAITNMEDVDPERVDGVTTPANGVNRFLIMKESGELQEVGKSSFSAEDRREYAHSGVALPDGSYPIPDVKHLKSAIHMVGLGKRPKSEIRRHIAGRARALGRADLIPESWKKVKKSVPQIGDGRGSLDSIDFLARVNEALAALQTSLDDLKQKDMLGGGQADPDPQQESLAKQIADLKKAIEANQPKIDRERQEDSTGEAGVTKDETRDKNGRFVSRKKYRTMKAYKKAYKKAYGKKDEAKSYGKKDEAKSYKKDEAKSYGKKDEAKSYGKKKKAYKMSKSLQPRSTSYQAEPTVSNDLTPGELVRKELMAKSVTPQVRAQMGQQATVEMIGEFAKALNIFPTMRRSA